MRKLLLLLLIVPGWAVAEIGSSRATVQGRFPVDEVAGFAKSVEQSLAENGVMLALVGRIGRPQEELPPGVEFTHIGLAVYSKINTADGRVLPGYATYNLYQKTDQLDESELVQDYMLDFFLGAQELKAGIIIPHKKLQLELIQMIVDDSWRELHNPRYSVMSNPFNDKYQNCTEFILNVIHAAIYDTTDMSQIKQATRDYYEPYRIKKNPLAVMLGGMFSKEIAVNDHDGAFETSTYKSIADYMEKYKLSENAYTIKTDLLENAFIEHETN